MPSSNILVTSHHIRNISVLSHETNYGRMLQLQKRYACLNEISHEIGPYAFRATQLAERFTLHMLLGHTFLPVVHWNLPAGSLSLDSAPLPLDLESSVIDMPHTPIPLSAA